MNILFLYPRLGVGGAQKVIIDLVNNLDDKEFKIVLGCNGGERISQLNKNIKIEKIDFLNKSPLGILKSIIELTKVVKKNNIQVIHSHHRYTTAISNILFKFNKNIKVIHTEHNVFPDKNFINLRGENIIAVSNVVRDNLIKNRVKEKNVKLIYNGIKVDESITLNDRNDDIIRIGVIARLNKQKGHMYLLMALKDIVKHMNNIKVSLIGDGEEKDRLLGFVENNELGEYIEFCGNVDDVPSIIQKFDFFILPSEYEGLPISILEVMSKMRILIATDVGGNCEIIEDGVNGFIVEPKNVKALENKLNYVIKNFNKLDIINKKAYETIKNNFSLENMVEYHKKYYYKIISK